MIRKPNILLFTVILISMVMTSCVEEYEIDDRDFESRLVINALFDSNSPWAVEVSKSVHAFDPEAYNEKISFAKVEIFDQNNEFRYELYHQGDGIYGNQDYGPSPKRAYSVKVSAPGFRAVTAKGFVPEKSTLLINNFSIIKNDQKNDVEVDFEIEDKSKLESYYIWEVVNIGGEDGGGDNNSSSLFSDTWIDDLTNNPNELVSTDRKFLENGSFGDGTYQGSYSSLDGNRRIGNANNNSSQSGFSSSESLSADIASMIKMDPSTITDPDEVIDEIDELDDGDEIEDDGSGKITYNYELRVMTISKELYNYYSSLAEYYKNGQNSHSNEVPFILYSNVKNGAGIFAGFSESVIQF